jgi:hypothetical protein
MGKEKFLLATLHLVLGAYISVGETLQAADLEKLASVSLSLFIVHKRNAFGGALRGDPALRLDDMS